MGAHRSLPTDSFLWDFALPGYPTGFHPVDGEEQIPWLSMVHRSKVPIDLVAFNDRGRASDPRNTGIHFYKHDEKFLPTLLDLPGHITNFGGFGLIITPDISVGDSMPLAQRTSLTVWSRQAGVVLERHGLTVVPNVRWILPTDYDMIARGIPQRSVIAVSNYGSRRDPLLRKRFDEGLPAMIERLAPEVVLVYGSTRPRVFTSLKNRTEFIEYRPKTATEPITRQSFRGMVPLFDIPAWRLWPRPPEAGHASLPGSIPPGGDLTQPGRHIQG